MNPNLSRQQIEAARKKKKKMIYMATSFVLGYLMILFLFGEVSLPHYLSMRKTYQQMKTEIDQLKTENINLKRESEALRSNPEQIESLAREELGLTKKGEIIYEFPKNDPPLPTLPKK